MPREKILNAKVWPRIGLDHAPSKNSQLLLNNSYKAELAVQLLLYDQVVIPTNDFGIIPILESWMGHSTFIDALSSKSIEFVRTNDCLGYAGNGNGLNLFVMKPGDTKPFEWWQQAMFGGIEESLEIQLANSFPKMPYRNIQVLNDLVLSNTSKFHCENENFIKNVANESYVDAMKTPFIRDQIIEFYESKNLIKLTHLPEVQANQMRVSGIEEINDAVDLVLRVAEVNMEIQLAVNTNGADIFTSAKTEDILNSKIDRAMSGHESVRGLTQLFELAGVPNIELAVANDLLEFSDIWKVRTSKNSTKFREWFRKAQIESASDIEKAYVEALSVIPSVASLPIKTLRFVVTTIAGSLEPITGIVAGAVNSYFIDKWLSGYNPRLFIDEVRTLEIDRKKT